MFVWPCWLARSTNLTPPFPSDNQVAFIKQEALKKAQKIRVKADEEFAIEKVAVVGMKWGTGLTDHLFRSTGETRQTEAACHRRSVRKETQRGRGCTEDVYIHRANSDAAEHRVASSAHSTLTNKSRLRLLHLREQNLQDLFQASREQLVTLASSSQYVQFLQGVIVQRSLQILDTDVTVHVRETDAAAAKPATGAASKQYTEITGRQIKYELAASLSPDLYVELAT